MQDIHTFEENITDNEKTVSMRIVDASVPVYMFEIACCCSVNVSPPQRTLDEPSGEIREAASIAALMGR